MAQPLSSKIDWALANPQWAAAINPILSNALVSGKIIQSINLVANTPKTINHGLGRMMQGWFVTDTIAAANVWRTQNFNPLAITLEASANTTISVWVF